MAIEVGQKIPDMKLKMADGEDVSTTELFRGKKAVLFAVPGAFTPTCSDYHLPGFVENADEIKAKGVDLIACVAVNDHFVLAAWAKARQTGDKILMLADGNGDFARALGLEMDARSFGLGIRSKRYAAVIEDGMVQSLKVDQPGKLEMSTAEEILKAL
jgi:glutaredoxin/glutathione-dependent peroxiredoxin